MIKMRVVLEIEDNLLLKTLLKIKEVEDKSDTQFELDVQASKSTLVRLQIRTPLESVIKESLEKYCEESGSEM